MGTFGAALATVIGQIISFVIAVCYISKFKSAKVTKQSLKPCFSTIGKVASLGVSNFITQISIVILSSIVNNMMKVYGAESVYGWDIPIAASLMDVSHREEFLSRKHCEIGRRLRFVINQIEIFDTALGLLAGLMIIPTVYTFMGMRGMSAGPVLMFVSLPKIFQTMGCNGNIIGLIFFLIVSFAAVTSSVSIMEAIVSSLMDFFRFLRKKSSIIVSIYALIVSIIVCLGYSMLYFEATLPSGTVGQILDIMDYISNNCLMPLVALLTCLLIGRAVRPKTIIDKVTQGKYKFQCKTLYIIMIKFAAPILLIVLLLQSVKLFH